MSRKAYKIESSFEEVVKDGNKWTGSFTPKKGDKILVTFNNLGTGTIEGFFSENGYIGVLVKPDKPPDWWRKRNPSNEIYNLFGIEIEKS